MPGLTRVTLTHFQCMLGCIKKETNSNSIYRWWWWLWCTLSNLISALLPTLSTFDNKTVLVNRVPYNRSSPLSILPPSAVSSSVGTSPFSDPNSNLIAVYHHPHHFTVRLCPYSSSSHLARCMYAFCCFSISPPWPALMRCDARLIHPHACHLRS